MTRISVSGIGQAKTAVSHAKREKMKPPGVTTVIQIAVKTSAYASPAAMYTSPSWRSDWPIAMYRVDAATDPAPTAVMRSD